MPRTKAIEKSRASLVSAPLPPRASAPRRYFRSSLNAWLKVWVRTAWRIHTIASDSR
jgi:hypothetical protein